ncbi:MAG TPA: DUF3276 family protein [Acidobacteriota bacterium]
MPDFYSKMLKAGKTTFFFDIKMAKNETKYLVITASQVDGDRHRRSSIRVFGDAIAEFQKTVNEAVANIG